MKIYIHSDKNGIPHNHNLYNAYEGFCKMGFETVMFSTHEKLYESEACDVVVSYVDTVRSRLADFGITAPEMDYPSSFEKYLGRKIWKTTLNRINSCPECWNVFVKPVEDKKFTGVVVRSAADLIGCGMYNENPEVYCSEILNIKAEWRVFVRYGRILDVRPYKGDWKVHFDPSIIENAVHEFENAPNGYAIDFGITREGRTVLIEVNDGYSLGCYGLNEILYAKLLSARWAELTGTVDECAFDLQ